MSYSGNEPMEGSTKEPVVSTQTEKKIFYIIALLQTLKKITTNMACSKFPKGEFSFSLHVHSLYR